MFRGRWNSLETFLPLIYMPQRGSIDLLVILLGGDVLAGKEADGLDVFEIDGVDEFVGVDVTQLRLNLEKYWSISSRN